MVCIVYWVCEADTHLLRVCTFTLRFVIMHSLECLVNKNRFGDLCNLVHQFYNERLPTLGIEATDVRGIVYFKFVC